MEGQAQTYYTIPQLAEFCGVPKSALYAAARRGDLKTAMPKGCERLTLVKMEWFEEWSRRMIPGKNNAPVDWSPQGAAINSTDDSTTFADDARFAARALGAGELFEGASTPRRLLGSLGIAMVGVGWVLLLGIVL